MPRAPRQHVGIQDAGRTDRVYPQRRMSSLSKGDAVFRYYPRLARVKEYVEQSNSRRVPLNDAARVACLERKYFSVYFRAKMGVTFTHWQTTVRIERAVRILESRDESVTRVAWLTGFRSLRTFERAFKQCLGVTPFEFKLSVRP